MPNRYHTLPPQTTLHVYTFFLLLLLTPSVLSKSPRPISDNEIREKKNECYEDIESGLWGQQCKSSMTGKENCVLRCLSPACYELVYESDPLEEGEKDLVRSQEYKYCIYKWKHRNSLKFLASSAMVKTLLSIGESLEGIKGAFNY